MDKIYSRKRITIPKVLFSKFPERKEDLKKRRRIRKKARTTRLTRKR